MCDHLSHVKTHAHPVIRMPNDTLKTLHMGALPIEEITCAYGAWVTIAQGIRTQAACSHAPELLQTMTAYLVLLLAVFSRLLPHAFGVAGINVTAVGGGLLYFGARQPRWQAWIAAAAMALTDLYLTVVVYRSPFHVRSYLITWIWYAGVCLLGRALLSRDALAKADVSQNNASRGASGRPSPGGWRILAAAGTSATSFFLLSNFVVWMGGMYPHTAAGLAACYAAAVPFYANDLASTVAVAGVLLRLPVLLARWMRAQPVATR
jgi:hypothetical protein